MQGRPPSDTLCMEHCLAQYRKKYIISMFRLLTAKLKLRAQRLILLSFIRRQWR